MKPLIPHKDISVTTLSLGDTGEPLLIVDNFLANPEALLEHASTVSFQPDSGQYPGVRAQAPASFNDAIHAQLSDSIRATFGLARREFKEIDSFYSVVTTAPQDLNLLQQLPHFDRTQRSDLASVYYLCAEHFGGTAFYRHRSTEYEYVDSARRMPYLSRLDKELTESPLPKPPQYLNGSTPLFEQIGITNAIFNRLIIYRCTSLHSGCIASPPSTSTNLTEARLTIASFLHS
ncbi:DUF6445 family protein [Teredinibacter waterburyi]|jgi:hypothetical protein|uniref:DUF6445 family protein n=1 Tax=Teredinibacter waterburyi TaxID=1500538 RepID=UPI00165F76B2|nr:DUF6445 family protein [Teredinibacter waterburyi]